MSTYIYNSLRASWIIYPCSLGTWGSRGVVITSILIQQSSPLTHLIPPLSTSLSLYSIPSCFHRFPPPCPALDQPLHWQFSVSVVSWAFYPGNSRICIARTFSLLLCANFMTLLRPQPVQSVCHLMMQFSALRTNGHVVIRGVYVGAVGC